jgi:hypothetical protein
MMEISIPVYVSIVPACGQNPNSRKIFISRLILRLSGHRVCNKRKKKEKEEEEELSGA